MNSEVRVRFAPSPTGPLHIGGVRTALYNYLFARKHNGKFILRIEDTDQARFVEGAEDYVRNSLKWLGLDYDEGPEKGGDFGPYKQSERKEIYKKYVDKLLDEDNAYIAFDTQEELNSKRAEFEAEKSTFKYDSATRMQMKNSLSLGKNEVEEKMKAGESYVVRIKIPENKEIKVEDVIRGEVLINSKEVDDKVLFKSDGLPTYHLANIVDDHLMKISHVIRGEEWLPSTPLHVLLYDFLGWKDSMPKFAHIPLTLKPTGKGKLSKRDGDKGGFPVFPLEWNNPEKNEIFKGYRESGYFPEAVVNILVLLGWNPGTEQEVFSLDELIDAFSLDNINNSGARFDPDKAKWFNHSYLQKKSNEELTDLFIPILKEKNITLEREKIIKIVSLIKERADFVVDLWEQSSYFFVAPEDYDKKVVKKKWKQDTPEIVSDIKDILQNTSEFTSTAIENEVKKYIEKNELGFGQVMNPLRLCLVGSNQGAHLFDIMEIIGKEETISRIERGLKTIKK